MQLDVTTAFLFTAVSFIVFAILMMVSKPPLPVMLPAWSQN